MPADRLSVPEVLAKPRDHAIICTFGAQLDFYEGPLWRYVSRARNRIILADDVVLASQLGDLASGGSRLRHVNRHYVATPSPTPAAPTPSSSCSSTPPAARCWSAAATSASTATHHAARCSIATRSPTSDVTYLPEFQAAKELLDLMTARGYLDNRARHTSTRCGPTPRGYGRPPPGRPVFATTSSNRSAINSSLQSPANRSNSSWCTHRSTTSAAKHSAASSRRLTPSGHRPGPNGSNLRRPWRARRRPRGSARHE